MDTAVQASDDVTSVRPQGRPRDASRDTAILEAALALVGELGYDRVSMDAVAARARASKATIYRRWSSKGALVSAAVRCRRRSRWCCPTRAACGPTCLPRSL